MDQCCGQQVDTSDPASMDSTLHRLCVCISYSLQIVKCNVKLEPVCVLLQQSRTPCLELKVMKV